MENNLKKEFSKRDVQRMRSIITGNTGDRTQIQTGWEKDKQTYKEGDTWEENGRRWTIKNGIKQTVTKLDEIKKLVVMPLCCPSCGGVMKLTDVEKKMWSIHRTCFDCVLKKEAEIKKQGKWEEYESGIMNRNKNAALDDLGSALEEWVDERESYVTEAGDVESWKGGDRKEVYKQVKERIAELKKLDIYKQNKSEQHANQ
jgi:hypothetical protein